MPSAHDSTASDEQTLSHYALRLLKQNGGSIPLLRVVRGAADVGLDPDTARRLIDSHSPTAATFTTERNNSGEQVITHVSPTGSCPDIVEQHFGADATDIPDIISLNAVDTEDVTLSRAR